MKNYQKFTYQFMESWKNLEGGEICKLFADEIEYYENPIDKPLTQKEDIKPLWAIVPQNQKDISYRFDILAEDEERCMVHFIMTRTMTQTNIVQNIDGVFEIKLNENNLLTYFKQWRFTKEN